MSHNTLIAEAENYWPCQDDTSDNVVVNNGVGAENMLIIPSVNSSTITTTGPTTWLPKALSRAASTYIAPAGASSQTDILVNDGGSTAAWTVALWIRQQSATPATGFLFAFGDSTDNGPLYGLDIVESSGRKLRTRHRDGRPGFTGTLTETIATTVPTNSWIHAAVTLEGDGRQRLYVNGIEEDNDLISHISPFNTPNKFILNALQRVAITATAAADYAGVVSFDRVLTASEILELYIGPEPTNSAAPVSSYATGTLSVTNGTWNTNNGAIAYTYQWQLDSGGFADISGATNSTYVTSTPGDYRCIVTATNDGGPTTATSNTTTVVAASDLTTLSKVAGGSTSVSFSITGTGSLDVNWGDSSSNSYDMSSPIIASHTYGDTSGYVITLTGEVATIIYTGDATIAGDLADLNSTITQLSFTGANTLTGDLADAPSGMTHITVHGSNTISGASGDAPSGLLLMDVRGSNTISGGVSTLPSGLLILKIWGSNTLTGNIAGLLSSPIEFDIRGSNTVSGDLADMPPSVVIILEGNNTIGGIVGNIPSSCQTFILAGANTITGDINTMPSSIRIFNVSGSNTLTATGMPSGISEFTIDGAMNSGHVDAILIDRYNDRDIAPSNPERIINLLDAGSAPTIIGSTYVSLLENYRTPNNYVGASLWDITVATPPIDVADDGYWSLTNDTSLLINLVQPGSAQTAEDFTSYNNDSTWTGVADYTQQKYGGFGFSFIGESRLDSPIMASLDGLTEFTLSAMVRSEIVDDGGAIINIGPDFQLQINSSGFAQAIIDDAVGTNTVTGSTDLLTGTWRLVTVTASDTGVIRLFVDGQQEGTITTANPYEDSGSRRVRVGARHDLDGNHDFYGAISDVRVYDRALTPLEASQLAAGPEPTSIVDPEIVVYTDFIRVAPGLWTSYNNGTFILMADIYKDGQPILFNRLLNTASITSINISSYGPGLYNAQIKGLNDAGFSPAQSVTSGVVPYKIGGFAREVVEFRGQHEVLTGDILNPTTIVVPREDQPLISLNPNEAAFHREDFVYDASSGKFLTKKIVSYLIGGSSSTVYWVEVDTGNA